MATATATVTLDAFPGGAVNMKGSGLTRVSGSVAIQSSPATYATGGLTLSFVGDYPKVLNQVPQDVFFESVGGGLYDYGWNKSANKFQIFTASAAAAGGAVYEEMPSGTAIPAGISGDTIRFEAWFATSE